MAKPLSPRAGRASCACSRRSKRRQRKPQRWRRSGTCYGFYIVLLFPVTKVLLRDSRKFFKTSRAKAQRMRGGAAEAAREALAAGGMPLVLATAYTGVL